MQCNCKISGIDPIPGQIYSSKVVNENGQGIKAGFIFLDLDGNEISQPFFTDDAGAFHFTVPDANQENIFVNFYSTDQYSSVVKSFYELVNEESVVLENKNKNISSLLLLSGGALALLVFSKTKN